MYRLICAILILTGCSAKVEFLNQKESLSIENQIYILENGSDKHLHAGRYIGMKQIDTGIKDGKVTLIKISDDKNKTEETLEENVSSVSINDSGQYRVLYRYGEEEVEKIFFISPQTLKK